MQNYDGTSKCSFPFLFHYLQQQHTMFLKKQPLRTASQQLQLSQTAS